jgi:hypothetical protein
MTALILDPIYESFGDRASQFAELAQERMSRPIRRLPFFDGKMDGRQWMQNVSSAVEEAEILICLGDFTILRQFGSDALQLINAIKDKSSCGCPILFQIIGMRKPP